MRSSRLPAWTLASVILVTSAGVVWGQATQGTILGTVSDSSGAVVPGAPVVVRNEATNISRTLSTNEAGDYRAAGLEPGSYEIAVNAPGFKVFKQTQVDLAMSQIKRVDVKLAIGATSDSIVVEGGTTQVETETVTLSNVKAAKDFTQLPMSPMGRAFTNIVSVTAGVQSTSGIEVNGARDTANNFTADGISVNDMISSRQTQTDSLGA